MTSGCFQVFGIIHKATVTSMRKFFVWPCFDLFWVNTKNVTVAQEGKSMGSFVNCQIIFPSGLPCWSFCQQCVRTPVVPHPQQHFVLSIFLDFVVLICLPLLRDEEDYNFIDLIAIYVSSFEMCVKVKAIDYFLIWLFSDY